MAILWPGDLFSSAPASTHWPYTGFRCVLLDLILKPSCPQFPCAAGWSRGDTGASGPVAFWLEYWRRFCPESVRQRHPVLLRSMRQRHPGLLGSVRQRRPGLLELAGLGQCVNTGRERLTANFW